jgi:hypothetical protein
VRRQVRAEPDLFRREPKPEMSVNCEKGGVSEGNHGVPLR